jgi:hypothetical protein
MIVSGFIVRVPPSIRRLLRARLCPGAQERVTFYPTYGYREIKDGVPGHEWIIPIRLRVWELGRVEKAAQRIAAKLMTRAGKAFDLPNDASTEARLSARITALIADDESNETVSLRFKALPSRSFPVMMNGQPAMTSKDGRLDGEVRIAIADLPATLRVLDFEADGDHEGNGRVHLLDPTGLSIVSDIDDTVKITGVRDGAREIIANTFFRGLQPAASMAARYATWSDAAFHYVSGGPWQLAVPITEFLQQSGFPAGSLHMRDFPLHPLSLDTWETLPAQLFDSMATFDHKVREISELLRCFPARRFILIGDSGEKDPEIYREIRTQFGPQVQQIIIRDVAHEPERLDGMEVIGVAR